MKQGLISWLAGTLFALGLGLAGMTQPAKVVGFLDLTGSWDPSLAFVMVGAILVHLVTYRIVARQSAPWLAPKFLIPTRGDVDGRLVGGAALFGLGWGIAGYCPGPGIVSTASGGSNALVFALTLVIGMLLQHAVDGWLGQRRGIGSAPARTA